MILMCSKIMPLNAAAGTRCVRVFHTIIVLLTTANFADTNVFF